MERQTVQISRMNCPVHTAGLDTSTVLPVQYASLLTRGATGSSTAQTIATRGAAVSVFNHNQKHYKRSRCKLGENKADKDTHLS